MKRKEYRRVRNAAPALLRALQQMLNSLPAHTGYGVFVTPTIGRKAVGLAAKAIAKATGGRYG